MGGGNWTTSSFVNYTTGVKGLNMSSSGTVVLDNLQENFKARHLHKDLDPKNIIRECRETSEHPYTIPIILALDCTGSMSSAAVETAKSLNNIMEDILGKVQDVEFCIMGIGDLAYDYAPIQMSQFESDIRIAEHLDKVWFEFGGGGNSFESYTAAWYMAARHTDLDCWKRGKKGIIITLGDENMNPYLPKEPLQNVTGDIIQADIETKDLYEEVKDKYDVYHIYVDHGSGRYKASSELTFTEVIPKENYFSVKINALPDTIAGIVTGNIVKESNSSEGISW